MIWMIMSLGALNALIPLLVIIILIGAAGMSMRNFSFFNIFGIEALFGITGGSGKSSLRGKSLSGSVVGPKSVMMKRGARPSFGAALYKNYYPISIPGITKKGDAVQKFSDKRYFVNKSQEAMLAGSSLQISLDAAKYRQYERSMRAWKRNGSTGTPPSRPKSALEGLVARHPNEAAVAAETAEKATTLRQVGFVIDENHKGVGVAHRVNKSLGRNKIPYGYESRRAAQAGKTYMANYEAKVSKALDAQGISKKQKEASLRNIVGAEKPYASIVAPGILWEAQQSLGRHQAAYDRLSAITKQKIDQLDADKASGRLSERDYNSQREKYLRKWRTQSAWFYDQAHRGLNTAEAAVVATSMAKGMGHAIKGQEDEANKHFDKANKMLARGVQYKGTNTFGANDKDAHQYAPHPGGEASLYESGDHAKTEEEKEQERMHQYQEREERKKKKAEKKADNEKKEEGK